VNEGRNAAITEDIPLASYDAGLCVPTARQIILSRFLILPIFVETVFITDYALSEYAWLSGVQ
jgi:hypothetical protein